MSKDEKEIKETISLGSKEDEEEVITLTSQINFKKSSSAPINTKNLPLKQDFEIIDNTSFDLKETKSHSNNENIILKLLGNKRHSSSMSSLNKKEEKKEPELSLLDKIKFFDTPYDKLACLSREIGLQIMIDYIINIINNNKRNLKRSHRRNFIYLFNENFSHGANTKHRSSDRI